MGEHVMRRNDNDATFLDRLNRARPAYVVATFGMLLLAGVGKV